MKLIHLTINTNHARVSLADEVSAEALQALAPWTIPTAERAWVLPGFQDPDLSAKAWRGPGWAQLEVCVGPQETPVVHAVVVWSAAAEARIWPRILDQTRQAGLIATRLDKPSAPPWLAAALLPASASLPQETIMALGDLERCWAWAVLSEAIKQ